GVSLHAWGLRLRGVAPRSQYRVCALLPSVPPDDVGSPERGISELNTQPTDTPVQRFKCDVTAALTWLGARVVRYSFSVRLFHSLLHAGLSRRYPDDRLLRNMCASALFAAPCSLDVDVPLGVLVASHLSLA